MVDTVTMAEATAPDGTAAVVTGGAGGAGEGGQARLVGGAGADGGNAEVTGGASTGSGDGGDVRIKGGRSVSGVAGQAIMTGADGGATSGDGGEVLVAGGSAQADGKGGSVTIQGGDAYKDGTDRNGGDIIFTMGSRDGGTARHGLWFPNIPTTNPAVAGAAWADPAASFVIKISQG